MTRRDMLLRLSALFATGAWPGWARAEAVGSLTFTVANDFHHDSPECDPWFERLFRQMKSHEKIRFCAGVGDLANRGRPESMRAVVRASTLSGAPFYPIPGNHDNDLEQSTRIYEEAVPGRLNYAWESEGWQFVAIDSTEGKSWKDTQVSARTLAWLDAELPRLDRRRPVVLFSHFPLSPNVQQHSVNADEVLGRFLDYNLRGVFTGHYHARTVNPKNGYEIVTNACCSRVAGNHDGSTGKGYFLVRGLTDGRLEREFVRFNG